MLRWRDLLTSLQVPWGHHHTGRGWISLRCPWCGANDPSQNFGINEEHGGYHCFRVAEHSGKSPYFLLKALGVPTAELDQLIERYGGTPGRTYQPPPEPQPAHQPNAHASRWERLFRPAADSREALDYLAERGFKRPVSTCERYDLRTAAGRWAGRLWFPLRDTDEQIVGYTGRAMRGQAPRYFTQTSETTLYAPRPVPEGATTAIIVEGPFDALRIADALDTATPDEPAPGYSPAYPFGGAVHVVALCGLSLTGNHFDLFALSRHLPRFLVALDASVDKGAANQLIRQLKARRLYRLPLPAGYDDAAEMDNDAIRHWLWGAWDRWGDS